MPRERLREALSELNASMHQGDTLDEADIALLADLQSDLERILDSTEERRGPLGAETQEGVGDAISRLEASHPQVTALLNRVALALTALGI